MILSALPAADVVMLSEAEAETHRFLLRAKAIELGELSSDNLDAQVLALVGRLKHGGYLNV